MGRHVDDFDHEDEDEVAGNFANMVLHLLIGTTVIGLGGFAMYCAYRGFRAFYGG